MSNPVVKASPIPKGYVRQWVRCCTCANVSYYDYVPFSFSNPIMALPCGHGAAERNNFDNISPEEAAGALQTLRRAYMIVTASGSPQAVAAASEECAWHRAYTGFGHFGDWKQRRLASGWKCIVIDWSEVS